MKLNLTLSLAAIALILGSTPVEAQSRQQQVYSYPDGSSLIVKPNGGYQTRTPNSTVRETNGGRTGDSVYQRMLQQSQKERGCTTRFVGNQKIVDCP